MAESFYVTLDTLLPNDNAEDTRLVKRISEECKSKTFAELLEKMVDGSADEFNEQPYNVQEMQVANHVSDLLRQSNTTPPNAYIYLCTLSKDEPPHDIHVELKDKLSDYIDRILKTKSETGPSGEEVRYQKIDILMDGHFIDHTPFFPPFYVVLDIPTLNSKKKSRLVKRVEGKNQEGSFRSLLEIMADSNEDRWNDGCYYNKSEIKAASLVKKVLAKYGFDNNGIKIYVKSRGSRKNLRFGLDEKVPYSDEKILQTDHCIDSEGMKTKFQKILISIPAGILRKVVSETEKNEQDIKRFIFTDVFSAYYHGKISIKRGKKIKDKEKRGEIGFEKVKEGEYLVTLDLQPYIIEKNGEYFAFGAVKLGTTVKARDNQIIISGPPRVLNPPYKHPHIYFDNGIIDYGSLNWQNQRGVSFNHCYDLSDRKALAKRIAWVMREGKITIERGYVGNNVMPVYSLEHCNCKIADNRKDAEQYAREHGIQSERIIRND